MEGIQPLDYVAVGVYMAAVVGMGFYMMRQKDTADFFVAGRNVPWIAVSISIIASLFSAISFMSTPGEAVKNGLSMSVGMLVPPFALLFVAYVMLKHFYSLRSFSAYEYLEHRFNLPARCLGAGVFLASRSLYLGMVLYATAKAFAPALELRLEWIILVVGVVAIAYTTMGGLKAVIWSDVLQFAVVMVGVITICCLLANGVKGGFAGIFTYAFEHEHGWTELSKPEFYQFKPWSGEFFKIRLNMWVIILASSISVIGQFGTDQMALQRTFATKSLGDCQKSMAFNVVWNLVLGALLYIMGIGLFAYYSQNPDMLTAGTDTDQWATHFIVHGMPAGATGLLLAALLAAVMSTMDSGIHSLSTVTIADFFRRLGWGRRNEATDLLLARGLTVLWGVLAIGLAMMICRVSEKAEASLLEVVNVWLAMGNVLLGMFVLGMFTKRATAFGTLIGVAAGIITWLITGGWLYYFQPKEERISFLLVAVSACLVTIIVGYVASIVQHSMGFGPPAAVEPLPGAAGADSDNA